MNRAELIDAIAKQTGHSKADSERFLSAFIDSVEKNIGNKEGVKLVGFGTFGVAKRKARVGRNPQTGEEVRIPPRNVPVFKPGAQLKELVLGK